MPDTTNDIEALRQFLSLARRQRSTTILGGFAADCYADLTALVAERDALKKRVAELEPDFRVAARLLREERNELKQRVAELEAKKPADRDLRERLVCAALTAIVMAEASYVDAAEGAVCYADATLAAMRKGESDGK